MSSGVAPPMQQSGGSAIPRLEDAEKYIDLRLEETRRHVRAVDLTVASLKLCIGVLAYLLAAMVLDQWVLADGLGKGSRFVLWALLVLAGGWYCACFLIPLLVHRINPVFAAQTIEHARPSFKNGLINFLLLRREENAVRGDDLSKRVYQGLQVRTASELSRVTVGTTVDRLHVIRLGYLLASLVAICCVYFVVSPKNPLVSFGRVIFPWSRIGAPTRVTIESVDPGNVTAYQGDNLVVSAQVHGLRAGEPVSLHYSSVDGQSVDQLVPMSVPEGGFRHQGELPPGSLGFQQSLLYRVAAGDASSPTYRIDVQIPPAIVVDRVEYDYPAYTGLPQRVAVREGDIRAIEGTRVTIHGAANYPVALAFVELEGDSRPTVRMAADGSTAVGRLTLAMSRTDPTQPEYKWYQLRFTDPERRENRRPIRHRIDVIPDQKPEVRFVDPPPEEVQLPVNGSLELKVHAEDPDFGLRRVELRAEKEGRGLLIPPLLKKARPEKPHQAPFEAAYLFEPARWNLKAGDRIAYWAEAADCKEKADDPSFVGNVSETERRTILIVAGDPRQKPSEKPRPKQDQTQKPQPGQQQGKPGEQPGQQQQPGEQQQDQPGQAAEKPQGGHGDRSKDRQSQDKPSPEQDQPEEKPQKGDSGAENVSGEAAQSEQKAGGKAGGKPEKKPGKAKDQSQPGESGEPSDAQPPGGSDSQKADPTQAGKPGGKKDASGAQGDQPQDPVDGETNPGDAFQRILEDRRQQSKGQPGDRENQPKSDSQPDGEKPHDAQPSDMTQDSGNEPSQGEKKSRGKPKKSDAEQPAADQKAAAEKDSGKTPGGKGQEDDSQKGAKGQKPAAGAKGMDSQQADGKDAESKQEGDQGAKAKPKPGQKGDSGKSKPRDERDMTQDGADGQKSDAGPKGAAAEKKSSSPQESAGKRSKPSDGADPAKDSQPSEDSGDSDSKTGQPDASKAAPKGQKTDQGGKPEQSPDAERAGKPSGEPKMSERPEEKGVSTESMGGADEKKTQKDGDQQNGPKGAEPQTRPEKPGTGEPSTDKSSLPSPQEANQPRDKKAEEPRAGKPDEKKGGENDPSSPTTSPKTSDRKSDTEGDRSADGKAGGGQQAQQSGEGMAGSQTPADQGNQGAQERGEGETVARPGEQAKSNQPTGKSGDEGADKGSGTRQRPGGTEPSEQPQQDPSQKTADAAKGGQPGQQSSPGEKSGEKGGSTSGNPTTGGGEPGKSTQAALPPTPPAPPPDDPNLEYARKQTTLALEHLADQLAKEKSELLERLGWDRAYAENFLRQWEQMRKAANQPGPQGDAARRELDKALQSLGLRPTESRVQRAKTPADKIQQLQDAGRIPPPLEWMDYYKAYTEGVGASKE